MHASHGPLHAPSQQKPSTHAPLAHSLFATHTVPPRLAQMPLVVPALQDRPAPHDATPQQTPSTQYPLGHAAASVQLVPRPSMGMHAFDLQ